MIKKLTYDTDKCLIDCDGIVIPSHDVRVLYNSKTAKPFVYFDPKSNYDDTETGVAIVGPNGTTHRDLVNQNMMLIRGKYQLKNEKELLRGRIWENVKDFGDMITIWDAFYGGSISSDLINRIRESLCIHEGINIDDMWLAFLCDKDTCDYYLITVDDYIFGGYSDKKDLIAAYERQSKMSSGPSDKYKDWDYKNQGVGYLGYHLMTRQDESNCKKMVFTESDIKYMVNECVNRCIRKYLNENLKTHDNEFNIYEKLEELDISYDFINDRENILEIQTPNKNIKDKVRQLLNYYGWKEIKDNEFSICAERIYGDEWNDFYDTEAEKDDDYPYGVGIYYHITPSYKVPKILRQGLTVREGNKLGYARGERTYLISYPSPELAYDLFRDCKESLELTILLVDIRDYIGKQINIYHDDFTNDDGAVYTYDYIPPQCIKVYDTLEV